MAQLQLGDKVYCFGFWGSGEKTGIVTKILKNEARIGDERVKLEIASDSSLKPIGGTYTAWYYGSPAIVERYNAQILRREVEAILNGNGDTRKRLSANQLERVLAILNEKPT